MRGWILCLLTSLLCVLLVGCNFVDVDTTPLHFVVDGETYCDMDVTAFRGKGLAMPEKEGYRFDGWYADMACTQSIRPASCRTETTIYGRYVKLQQPLPTHTIRFCYEDGTLYATTTATTLDNIIYPAPPTKEGFMFVAWRGLPDALTDDIVLLATFRSVYTVVFLGENDEVLSADVVVAGAYVTPPEVPAKEEDEYNTYRFAGWLCEQGDYVNVQSDVVVRVQYAAVPKQYRYVFHPNNGQTDIVGTDEYNAVVPVPTVSKPNRDAYTYRLAGWDTDGDGTADSIGRSIRLTADFEAWALYTEQLVVCTIRFWVDDSVVYTESVPYGHDAQYEQQPVKQADAQYSYTFARWDAPTTAVMQDSDIHALFDKQINLYSYSFVDDGVVCAHGDNLPYGTLIDAPADATRTNTASTKYVFEGWRWDTTWYTEGMTLQQDCVFEAVFHSEIRTYTIEFFNGLNNQVTQYTLPYGAVIQPAPFPDDDAYQYQWIGWVEGTTVTRDRTYTLLCTPVMHTVTWHIDTDIVYTVTQVQHGNVAVPPDDPQLDGYTFAGWGDMTAAIDKDTDYWAQWTSQS